MKDPNFNDLLRKFIKLVVDPNLWTEYEDQVLKEARQKKVPPILPSNARPSRFYPPETKGI